MTSAGRQRPPYLSGGLNRFAVVIGCPTTIDREELTRCHHTLASSTATLLVESVVGGMAPLLPPPRWIRFALSICPSTPLRMPSCLRSAGPWPIGNSAAAAAVGHTPPPRGSRCSLPSGGSAVSRRADARLLPGGDTPPAG